MPVTQIDFPILLSFNCAVQKMTGADAAGQPQLDKDGKPLPKGVVLGPDGKPYVSMSITHRYEEYAC